MSQPVLSATFALAITVVLTTATAFATLALGSLRRAIKLTVVGAVVAVAVVEIQRADLRVNFTSSMPIGIYSLVPLPRDGVKRGMLVAACAPTRAAEIGRQRGYLGTGPCAGDAELLLKSVMAIAGDEVDVTPAGVTVNGCLLARSQPAVRDRSGRRLTAWPLGRYLLGPDQVWLYAPVDRSWDSRYWGPAPAADVRAGALPLLVLSQHQYP